MNPTRKRRSCSDCLLMRQIEAFWSPRNGSRHDRTRKLRYPTASARPGDQTLMARDQAQRLSWVPFPESRSGFGLRGPECGPAAEHERAARRPNWKAAAGETATALATDTATT